MTHVAASLGRLVAVIFAGCSLTSGALSIYEDANDISEHANDGRAVASRLGAMPLRRALDMGPDRMVGIIDPAELLDSRDHLGQPVLPPGLFLELRPLAQRLFRNPGMLAVMTQRDAAEQFGFRG